MNSRKIFGNKFPSVRARARLIIGIILTGYTHRGVRQLGESRALNTYISPGQCVYMHSHLYVYPRTYVYRSHSPHARVRSFPFFPSFSFNLFDPSLRSFVRALSFSLSLVRFASSSSAIEERIHLGGAEKFRKCARPLHPKILKKLMPLSHSLFIEN